MSKKKKAEGPHLEDNEAFYDEMISPLMTQIIALCKERDIPHVCVFQLQGKDAKGGDPIHCTTTRVHKHSSDVMLRLVREIRRKPEIFAFTITSSHELPNARSK